MLVPITVSRDAAISLYTAGFRMPTYVNFVSEMGGIPAPSSDELMSWLLHRGYQVIIEMSAREMVASITKPWAIGGSGFSMADSLAALVEQILNLESAAQPPQDASLIPPNVQINGITIPDDSWGASLPHGWQLDASDVQDVRMEIDDRPPHGC